MDDEHLRAATELAVRLGVLARCDACGQTWRRGTIDLEDGDGLDEHVEAAEDIMDESPELDVFADASVLRAALATVIANAPGARLCRH